MPRLRTPETIYSVGSFPFSKLRCKTAEKVTYTSEGKKFTTRFYDTIITFDIETSTIKDGVNTRKLTDGTIKEIQHYQSFMYHAQFCVEGIGTVFCRTWEQVTEFAYKVKETLDHKYKRRKCPRMVIYVHNLSYEFQFMSQYFDFTEKDVFALKPRQILTARKNGIEFRCSLRLCNMGLDAFTQKYHAEHAKSIGDLDYSIIRYPTTELTPEEKKYCRNDVLGLVEALQNSFELTGHNIATVPLTSTGYVREDVRNALVKSGEIWNCRDLTPDEALYKVLRLAFRGGDTHANRFMVTHIVDVRSPRYKGCRILSVDEGSAYPFVMTCKRYPVTRFKKTSHDFKDLIRKGYAVLVKAQLKNIRLLDHMNPAPYIAIAKCQNLVGAKKDNGRVLEAKEAVIAFTDIDYKILSKEYEFEINVLEVYYSKYGYLPKALVATIIDYYTRKTELKGDPDNELYYQLAKALLNACYGMAAENPVKRECVYTDNDEQMYIVEPETEKVIRGSLYEQRDHGLLPYQWAVWTTAHARYALREGIWKAHNPKEGRYWLYCDTDSVKYVEKLSNPVNWDEINERRAKSAIEQGAIATSRKGISYPMGVFEDDGEYTAFVTLGAKKYSYVTTDGKLKVTCAGVNKAKAPEELKTIENFTTGFTFTEAGGLSAQYNDKKINGYIINPDNGEKILISRNVALAPSTYTIGIDADIELIEAIAREEGKTYAELL